MARNMTMAIPDKTFEAMKKHPEIKWTQIARQAIEQKAAALEAEKDPWKLYALRHALEDWDDADDLIEY